MRQHHQPPVAKLRRAVLGQAELLPHAPHGLRRAGAGVDDGHAPVRGRGWQLHQAGGAVGRPSEGQ